MDELIQFLRKVPGVRFVAHSPWVDASRWWVKLGIDLDDPLAWHVVQELGHVLNYLSLEERLPTVFMPVSPPPYANGGPKTFLSWVIEPVGDGIRPETVARWLDGRLPRPVDERASWALADDEPP
jgi:hypothetical protein